MNNIKYEPIFDPSDLRERIADLSEVLGKVLGALQCLQDCGAADIADDEAIFVQEVIGFYDLIDLVREEEFSEAINSVNKACWEIEVANEQGAKNVDHPWFGKTTPGCFETNTFCANWDHEFDHRSYGPTPKEEQAQRKWEQERKARQASMPNSDTNDTLKDF